MNLHFDRRAPPNEGQRYVFGIQQFDTEGGPPLSDRELERRWAQFHHNIRVISGNRLEQTVGRMLGENTYRYKVARFFGRPLLIVLRKLRHKTDVVTERQHAVVLEVPETLYFPINYRPHLVTPIRISTTPSTFASIEVVVLEEGGDDAAPPTEQLNELLETTQAQWLFLLDSAATSFDRNATLLALISEARADDDVVFADEAGTNPASPILKSAAVGPHTLLSYNVVGRPALLSVAALRRLGGFSTEAGWAFEHDAYLRLSEQGARFHHVAKVLPAGQPTSMFTPARISDDSCRVVQSSLLRRGWPGTVEAGELSGLVRWTIEPPSPAPSIDIVIPTRDRLDLVLQCIGSIEDKTTYGNYDIIILDNDSKDPATLEYFATCNYRVVPCPGPFNYAAIVNRGIKQSKADFVLTLNNDTIVVTPDWLERMVGLASLPDVGFVGGCLLDQEGRREHESIVIAPYPQHLRTDSNYTLADRFVAATRDVAAVTGAVQLVRREFWESLGGMDEELRVTMNDVDVCLRSQLAGRHVVYTPDVQLYHHVSSSRGKLDPLEDRNRFIRRWDIFGSFQDPYFPESLLLLGETIYYRFR